MARCKGTCRPRQPDDEVARVVGQRAVAVLALAQAAGEEAALVRATATGSTSMQVLAMNTCRSRTRSVGLAFGINWKGPWPASVSATAATVTRVTPNSTPEKRCLNAPNSSGG